MPAIQIHNQLPNQLNAKNKSTNKAICKRKKCMQSLRKSSQRDCWLALFGFRSKVPKRILIVASTTGSMEVRTANSPIGGRLNSFFSLIIQLNLNEFSLNQSPAMLLCVLNWICLRRSATPMMFFPHNLHPTTPLWNCKYFHLLEPFSTFCNYCISRIFLSGAIAQIVMWMN